ncbi:cell division protein FtsA [Thermocrinis minervae]|uniref:Cell division protein FtsA n=1 Tax=Thermocrinis minervae TaxID=381751 RepID=A0A1M6Q423_9AQUI|nr:cell division protein FtsA [Thermocrinis minervae]SHK14878.1 cell division protein FtsA [Thermocrinis minervae]
MIAALDVGTSKVVLLVGEIDTYNDINIIAIGETQSKGIERGFVKRLDLAVNSVSLVRKDVQEMLSSKVSSVCLALSGPDLKSQNERDTISLSPQPTEVDRIHIERLIERAITRSREEGYEVVAQIPRKFTLDDQEGIIDPVGLYGSRLSVELHVVKLSSTIIRNLEKVLQSAGLGLVDRYVSILASAEAVLTQEEKEEGVLLIDMGAGLTDFTLFLEGAPYITASIPMGGLNITKDIAHFLKVTTEQAERIKIEYGCALYDMVSETERIKIKPRGEEKETTIERRQLAEVIQIRLEEIMERLTDIITSRGASLEAANAGIVITGGCAKLYGIKEFLERHFDMPVRIGYPYGVVGLKEKISDPAYATAVGLLKVCHKNPSGLLSSGEVKMDVPRNSLLGSILEKIKSFLKDVI